MAQAFDLLVVGGGPGGYVAAIKAAQLGKKVGLIEAREVGGTCLNRGCIPTKTLIHTTDVLSELQHAETLGLQLDGHVTVDWPKLHSRKEEVVQQLRSGVESLLAANGVQVISGFGRLAGSNTVRVGDDSYTASNILLAVGSKPFLPPIPGSDLPGVMSSDELLDNAAPIPRLVIIGGGVIGVEFAGIYQAMGCQVTIVELQQRILPLLDREIGQTLSMSLKKRGVNILTQTGLQRIEQNGSELACWVQAKGEEQSIAADAVLIAIGRRAATENICCDDVTLEMQRGQIVVDESFQTSIPGVYAIGDAVVGSIQLAHAASAQGINAVCAMFGEEAPYDMSVIPSCIYSTPEIASVGIDEATAKERGIKVTTGKYVTSGNGKSIIAQADRGFIKLVFDAESDVLLGAQLVCLRATDMIGGLAQAVVNGLTRHQLGATIMPHPTFVEAVGEAVEDAGGHAIHVMPKRRL